MKFVIRTDSSILMGTGHVMRCRNLARELTRRGAEVTFVYRHQVGDLAVVIAKEFDVRSLPELPTQKVKSRGGPQLYAAWLGTSQQQDAKETLEIMGNLKPDWVIVDHYGLGSEWENPIRQNDAKIIVIDDLADRQHVCEVLIDQNWYGEETKSRYVELVSTKTKLKLGPRYALLDREYADRRLTMTRKRSPLFRVLIYFGGSDVTNQTCKALEAFNCRALRHLAIDVVISTNHDFIDEVVAKAQRLPNCTIYSSVPSMAEYIVQADLAIGAGGATTWERCCLGLPSIVVTIAANQEIHCKKLEKENAIIWLGQAEKVSVADLRSSIQSTKSNARKLLELSDNCKRYTDGHGAKRIVSTILGPEDPLSLRVSKAADEEILWYWANDPTVRRNSFSKRLITLEEHKRWYAEKLSSDHSRIFIAEMSDGMPIGQIRFDRDVDSGYATLDYSIENDFRGLGLGKHLVGAGIKAIRSAWGSLPIAAEILTLNAVSRAVITSNGFKQVSPRRSTADYYVSGL